MPEPTDRESEFADAIAAWMRKQFGWEEGKENMKWKDDWTLIVKLHAMIETALNGALMRELEKPALDSIIAKLDTSNQSTGKIALAKALGILPKASVTFIQKLSELRNLCVHDIRNFEFNLIDHLTRLEPTKQAELWKPVAKMIRPDLPPLCPQEELLVSVMCIMSELMLHDTRCQIRDLERAHVQLMAERFDEQNQSTPKE
jgi:hypothetical protein